MLIDTTGRPAWGLSARAVVWLTVTLAIAYGQLPPASSTARPKLVDLNVVALDSRDRPVADLSADDFQVADDGRPQRIVFFRQYDAALRVTPAPGPGEFSNLGGARPARATAILFDLLNESMGAAASARADLVRALERLESGQDLYLYLLTRDGRVVAVRPLPDDGGPSAARDADWTSRIKPLFEDAMKEASGLRPIYMDLVARVSQTYVALEAVARRLGSIPGRKNLVWITHGVPISFRGFTGELVDCLPHLRELSALFGRYNVAIYPVQQTPPGMAMPGSDEAQYSGLGSVETLAQFAELTGGRSKGQADISGTIRHALGDTGASYRIGYYPPASNWDGKYHKLRVTCARKGVGLQSKTGYYAGPDGRGDAEDVIGAIAVGSGDAGEIGLRVRATLSPADPKIVHVEARIDARDIALVRDAEQYTADLRIGLAASDVKGRAAAGKTVALDVRFNEAEREQALRAGIPYERDIAIGAQLRQVRLIVLDNLLGVAGSVTIPLEGLR